MGFFWSKQPNGTKEELNKQKNLAFYLHNTKGTEALHRRLKNRALDEVDPGRIKGAILGVWITINYPD